MKTSRVAALLVTIGGLPLTGSGLHAQIPQQAALATAAAAALEPGVRAALKDGDPISFEYRSDWGETVKGELEESLGQSLTSEHRRGASRILLGAPRLDGDTATVDVWYGRCETHAHTDVEILRIRMYSFTFRHHDQGWRLLRSSRLGSTEVSCDAELYEPGAVET